MTPSPAKMEAHAFQRVWTGTTASAHWPSEGKSTVVRMPGIPKIDYLRGGRAWGSPSCPLLAAGWKTTLKFSTHLFSP